MSKLFYIKKALGKNNKKLNIYKFRTMKPGSARREVYSRKKLDKFGKPKNSEMITPMGRFLRKYWLDEIPQIYQVLI